MDLRTPPSFWIEPLFMLSSSHVFRAWVGLNIVYKQGLFNENRLLQADPFLVANRCPLQVNDAVLEHVALHSAEFVSVGRRKPFVG